MAIYHCSIKIISRGKGKSAVAAAAYRSGEKIINEYDGMIHDYTRKGGIVHTEILLPDNAPPEFSDRSILWNAVEKIEKAKNSQLAREIEIALPKELTAEQQKNLVKDYCKNHFVSVGMCADICIHDKRDGNPHAHIMLTMRPFNEDRTWGEKQKKEYAFDSNGNKIYDKKKRQYKCKSIPTTDWNEQTKAEEWREAWANIANEYLQRHNIDERIDHRSYERQGIDKIPSIHLGVAASQMERRGIQTDRGNRNRKIKTDNQLLRETKARLNKLKNWLAAELKPPKSTQGNSILSINIVDILSGLLENKEIKSRYGKIADLKAFANSFSFLQQNGITTLPQLQEKLSDIRGRYDTIHGKMKANEKRQKVVNKHIEQAEKYAKYKTVYNQYQQLPPKKQATFYEQHTAAIIHFEAAERYLKQHMGNKKSLPLKAWKNEAAQLAAAKTVLQNDFAVLREEVRQVEVIKRTMEKAVNTEERGTTKKRDMEI